MPNRIIFKTVFGSHLYGTETEKSDTDYKGIFISSPIDIFLGRDKKVFTENTNDTSEKNSKDDVDTEYKELRAFLKDCMDGQTYALDMLFSPRDKWVVTSPEWEHIITNRDKLLSKNVAPYIGYCRTQAGKYGLKGSRLGELIKLINFLSSRPEKTLYEVIDLIEQSEFVKKVSTVNKVTGFEESFLEVLNNKYQLNQKLSELIELLKLKREKFGHRAELAMENEGVDWKAVSHAFRCMYQLEELFTTNGLVFPLKDKDRIRLIKQGRLEELGYQNFGELQDELYNTMERVINLPTSLPEQPDRVLWENWIISTYLNECNNL